MCDKVRSANLDCLEVAPFCEDDTRFCLKGVDAYYPEDPAAKEKVEDLLEGRVTVRTNITVEEVCNIGGCTLRIAVGPEKGRVVTGACTADSYCLKRSFAAVGKASTADEGGILYGKILDTAGTAYCDGGISSRCPRFGCDFSAGLSEDMVPGTDGECSERVDSGNPDQPRLDF